MKLSSSSMQCIFENRHVEQITGSCKGVESLFLISIENTILQWVVPSKTGPRYLPCYSMSPMVSVHLGKDSLLIKLSHFLKNCVPNTKSIDLPAEDDVLFES